MVFMFSRQQDLCLPSLEATSPFVLSLRFDWFIAFFLVAQIVALYKIEPLLSKLHSFNYSY